ncbi:hypothetical protein [Clavibacter michiganensis]|uniref:hypothetical protein n=1 Tax=Clavibacter michiganensis TaxID=28447 RepID=UPI0011AFE96C|nr:hypothetical protein [Clavibacter michiganensis]
MPSSPPPAWITTRIPGARVRVGVAQPAAVIERDDGTREVVAWPGLPTGLVRPVQEVAPTPGGVWVAYLPDEAPDGVPRETTASAVHISLDGRIREHHGLPAVAFLGATRHGLWLSTTGQLPDADAPAEWRRERELLVVAPDGTRHDMTTDRVPVRASDDGTGCRLVAFADGPERTPAYGGWEYGYAELAVALPAELPAVLRVDAHDAMPLPGGDEPEPSPAADPTGDDATRDDPTDAQPARPADPTSEEPARPDDPVIPWDLVAMPDSLARAATESLATGFGDPDAYWGDPRDTRGRAPLAQGMSGSSVTVVGEWPRTRVVVEFRHASRPGLLLRRTLPVFDAAGRIATAEYAAIHLMEDVETGQLPPAGAARDGILEV